MLSGQSSKNDRSLSWQQVQPQADLIDLMAEQIGFPAMP